MASPGIGGRGRLGSSGAVGVLEFGVLDAFYWWAWVWVFSLGGSAFGGTDWDFGSWCDWWVTDTSGFGGSTGSTGSTSGGIGSQSATSFSGGGAPFVGVGSSKSGESITVLNEQPSYQTWEFIYDPRIEQLKAKASLFGGGPATASGSTLGSAAGSASPGQSGAPTTAPGSTTFPGSSTTSD